MSKRQEIINQFDQLRRDLESLRGNISRHTGTGKDHDLMRLHDDLFKIQKEYESYPESLTRETNG